MTGPQQPAASPMRAVLSITRDEDGTLRAACTRCLWDQPAGEWNLLVDWAIAAAAHEEEHAPAVGDGIRIVKDPPGDTAMGLYDVSHDLASLTAVEFLDQNGQRHNVPRTTPDVVVGWDDWDGVATFYVPPTSGLVPVEVWLHGTERKPE